MPLLRASRRVVSRTAASIFVLIAVSLAVSFAVAEPAHAAPTLTLDNDAAGPLVTAAALAPGQQPPQCVQISYQSASAGDQIGVFAAINAGGTGLENYLNVTIAAGSGGVYGDCSQFAGTTIFDGTLAAFAASYGSSSTALTSATLGAGNGTVSYEFTFTLADDNAAQGKTADAWFTWLAEPAAAPLPSPSPSPSDSPSPSASSSASTSPTPSAPPSSSPSGAGLPSASATARTVPTGSGEAFPTAQPSAPAVASPSLASTPTTSAPSPRPPTPTPSRKHGQETTVPMFDGGTPPSGNSFLDGVKHVIGQIVQRVVHDAAPAAKGTAFSLIFLVLVVLFLLVHSRIDRRDPKLANAPLLPNFLHFDPPTPGGNHDVA